MNLQQALALIRFKTYADLRVERERTYLGLLWWVFEPALFMVVFYIVFGVLRGKGDREFVAFLLVGVVTWQWFRACISHCGNAVTNGLSLMRLVRLPPIVFPLIVIATDTVKYAMVLGLLILVLCAIGLPPGGWILALPLILLTQLLLILACGVLYAALVPFLPDIKFIVDASLMAMMFLTGIFFSIDTLTPEHREWVMLNPMAVVVASMRDVLLENAAPPLWRLGIVAGLSLLVILLAARLMAYLGPRYTKLPG